MWSRRAALCLVLAILPAVTLWPFLFTYSPADAVRKIYPGNFFAEMPEFAQRLETVTPPGKHVFIFGAEPELLFMRGEPPPHATFFFFRLYGPYRQCARKTNCGSSRNPTRRPVDRRLFPQPSVFYGGDGSVLHAMEPLLHASQLLPGYVAESRPIRPCTDSEGHQRQCVRLFPCGKQAIGVIQDEIQPRNNELIASAFCN